VIGDTSQEILLNVSSDVCKLKELPHVFGGPFRDLVELHTTTSEPLKEPGGKTDWVAENSKAILAKLARLGEDPALNLKHVRRPFHARSHVANEVIKGGLDRLWETSVQMIEALNFAREQGVDSVARVCTIKGHQGGRRHAVSNLETLKTQGQVPQGG
jgi:hypothetical protein